MANDANARKAEIYRMVMPDHLCPYGGPRDFASKYCKNR
ncbi:hypothetical protein HNR64_003315 [Spongiibacter marinus]|nr:hypothetical protein [Spongiibacter marinus]